jgi:hypothetical protein
MVLLAPGEYDVGCTITFNGEEIQLIADAQLPVVDGVVDA